MMLMQNKWGRLLQTSLGEQPTRVNWWQRFEDRVAGTANLRAGKPSPIHHLHPDLRMERSAVSQPVEKNTDPAAEVEDDFEGEIDAVIQDLILRGDVPQLPAGLREQLIEQAKQARKPPRT